MFLCTNAEEFNNHMISLDLWSLSDHAFLMVSIIKLFKIENKLLLQEKKEFINKLRNKVCYIDTTNIHNCKILEKTTQEFTFIIKALWYKYSKKCQYY